MPLDSVKAHQLAAIVKQVASTGSGPFATTLGVMPVKEPAGADPERVQYLLVTIKRDMASGGHHVMPVGLLLDPVEAGERFVADESVQQPKPKPMPSLILPSHWRQ